MQENFVDFKAVKAVVSMQMLVAHYQFDWLRKRGEELHGRCPIHQGEGQDTFHVSLSKNAFHCFSCKARGNVLDLVAAMEKCSIRDAALKLKDWFAVPVSETATEKPKAERKERGVGDQPTANKPLTFQLKGIDPGHAYLRDRGITEETASRFGVGFFSGKGSMSGRVVIPIHNERGELVAYAGRVIDGSEPRYKLPAGFHKSLELFNLHRAIGESTSERLIVVVEGFFDCIQVSTAGFQCVALMGSSMSETQEALIVRHFKAAWLMLDGDESGQLAMTECLGRLGRRMWVRIVGLPEGKQPDQLSGEQLQQIMPS